MNKKIFIFVIIIVIIAAAGIYWYASSKIALAPNNGEKDVAFSLTKEEARKIAESSACLKEGSLNSEEFYNENSKTWWFGIKAEKPGCNPACVVFEENKTAEINWRCTGLIAPGISATEKIQEIFKEKYDRYADSLSVTINQETNDHARGNVSFEPGVPGGLFLAAKIDGEWQVVHEGNGEIPCSLAKYGFPSEMLADCAD